MKRNHDDFVKKYQLADTASQKENLLKDYMLSMSFAELMDWNNFLSDNIDVLIHKNIKSGVTEEDKAFYRQQFARFDNIMEQSQLKVAA